jgi:hypothetical protein
MTEFLGPVKELSAAALRPSPALGAQRTRIAIQGAPILPESSGPENPCPDRPFCGGIRPLAARFAASVPSIRRCGQKPHMVCVGHESGRVLPYVAIGRNRPMMNALHRVRGEGSDQWD